MAVPQRVDAVDSIEQSMCCFHFRIWAIIFSALAQSITSHENPGIQFLRYANPGIGFVILQKNIVARLKFLNQAILEIKGLFLGIDNRILQIMDVAYKHIGALHRVHLIKVRRDAAFEIFCLTHIDYHAILVIIAIHTGSFGQQRYFKLQLISHR